MRGENQRGLKGKLFFDLGHLIEGQSLINENAEVSLKKVRKVLHFSKVCI